MKDPASERTQVQKKLEEAINELDDLRHKHSHLKIETLALKRTVRLLCWGMYIIFFTFIAFLVRSVLSSIINNTTIVIIIAVLVFLFFLPSILKRR